MKVADCIQLNFQDGPRFNWTQEKQGWILSAFFVGYMITHIPGGMIAEKYGGKWTLSLGVLVVAVCTAITPLAVGYGTLDHK